ncbi:MAG TPA: hypothetical protein DEP13_04670 [Gammaproteobacteria bacterium]|nr:MAG: hypothetical protein CBD74_01910 [Saprospirales bacterium TMED214]HCA35919.1 hypothetical protein [Gammaproteobacteria bacterium]
MPEMNFDVLTVCPQHVGCYVNKNHRAHKPLLIKHLEEVEPDFARNGLEHYEGNGSLLHEVEAFAPIKKWIEECALHFAETVLQFNVGGKMHCVGSWMNVASAQGFQEPHLHANSLISGTYYVRKSQDHSGLAFFANNLVSTPNRPFLLPQFTGPCQANTPDMTAPLEGNLLLWQSHLHHGYPASGVGGRISLSMNFLPGLIDGVYKMRLCKA